MLCPLVLSVVLPDTPHPPSVPPQSRAWPWSISMTWCCCVASRSTLGAVASVSFPSSMLVTEDVAVPAVVGAVISVAASDVLSAIVKSSASLPPSSASAISSTLPLLSLSSGAQVVRPSAILFATLVAPVVCMGHPAGCFLLLSRASLVGFAFFPQLLLNAI